MTLVKAGKTIEVDDEALELVVVRATAWRSARGS